MKDKTTSGFPTVGESGPPVRDLSGETPTVGATVRPAQSRDAFGRFAARKAREVGPLGPAGGVGPGGIDTVTGRFIPGVRNHAQLHDLEATTGRYHEARVWGRAGDPRRSHDGAAEAHDVINHVMTCPCHTTGGACCG
jgi:hypothetical protein